VSNKNFYPIKGSFLNGKYEVVDIRATSGGTIVLLCLEKYTQRRVAVKRFDADKLTKDLEKKAIEETKLNIQSDYLTIAEDHFYDNGFLNTVMPFVEGDTLREVLETQDIVDEVSALHVSLCLTKAAGDLHKNNILSTDIKPENTIIQPNGQAKLIDLACYERIGPKATVSKGTEPYAPPELLMHNKLDARTDIYTIGVVLSEMTVGSQEFNEVIKSWDLNIARGIKPDISFMNNIHPEIKSIVSRAIEPVPSKRYNTAFDLFNELLPLYNTLSGASSKKELRVLCGDGKEICILQGRTIVGRHMIDSSVLFISDKHFELDFDGNDNAKIRDVGSTNGTFVNGQKIGRDWVDVCNNDVIQITNLQLELRVSE
jgi:serine/threonine protein kinase